MFGFQALVLPRELTRDQLPRVIRPFWAASCLRDAWSSPGSRHRLLDAYERLAGFAPLEDDHALLRTLERALENGRLIMLDWQEVTFDPVASGRGDKLKLHPPAGQEPPGFDRLLEQALHRRGAGSRRQLQAESAAPASRPLTFEESVAANKKFFGQPVSAVKHVPSVMHRQNKNVALPSLTSSLAHAQLCDLADDLSEAAFIQFLLNTFGTDIPINAYGTLYRELSKRTLSPPDIAVIEGTIQGYQAAFNRKTGQVEVSHSLLRKAYAEEEGRALLAAALIEEYGHFIDWRLRNHYSQEGGDAPGDEGAVLAYQLFRLRKDQAGVDVAQVEGPEFSGTLTLDVEQQLAVIREATSWEQQRQDDQAGEREFFGAGVGDQSKANSWGHQSVELVLQNAGFLGAKDLPKIYFGNWLRDHAQIVDPALVRPSSAALQQLRDQGLLGSERWQNALNTTRLSREALTKLVALLAAGEFGDWAYQTITPATLGVYRPQEHLDNPTPALNPELDPRLIDPDFVAPPTPLQLAVNPETGLKNYIATPTPEQSFETAQQYMVEQLELAIANGYSDEGMRHFGQALHVLEDFFSHSNFVELSLIKAGYTEVVPWTEPVPGMTRLPLVTGTFAKADTFASIGPKLAGLFPATIESYQYKQPGERTEADRAILTVLKDLAQAQQEDPTQTDEQLLGKPYAEWLQTYEAYLHYRDRYAQATDNRTAQFILKTLHYSATACIAIANFAVHHLIDQMAHWVDDAQTHLQSLGTDPSHSQVGKDHDGHPLHALAAELAREAVLTVGVQMRGKWLNPSSAYDPVRACLAFIAHPVDTDWMDARVRSWATQNRSAIEHAESKDELERLGKRVEKNSERFKFWVDGQAHNMRTSWEELRNYVYGMER